MLNKNMLIELINAYWNHIGSSPTHLLVQIKSKWKDEITYEIHNELINFDFTRNEWVWVRDWYEGQDDVEYVGVLSISDCVIKFFTLKEQPNECSMCHKYGLQKNDWLYQRYDHDASIEFEEFRAQYCPICGKELKEDNR